MRWCSKIESEDSRESDRSKNDEKLTLYMLEVTFDFDSDAILLDYPRYAEHTE